MLYDDTGRIIVKGERFTVKLATPGEVVGPWRVILWATGIDLSGGWYICNTQTGDYRYIGKAGRGRGVNYYDRARDKCNELNRAQ